MGVDTGGAEGFIPPRFVRLYGGYISTPTETLIVQKTKLKALHTY